MGKKKNPYVTFLPEDAEKYISVYWGYYISLEDEFNKIYSNSNVDKYDEVRLYLAIGSEIDVVFKTICQLFNSVYDGDNINAHKSEIQKYIDDGDWDDYHAEVQCKSGAALKPWDDTSWWTDYNHVKHKRTCIDKTGDLYFSHANKSNIMEALAALYILERSLFVYMEGYLFYDYTEMHNCHSSIFK